MLYAHLLALDNCPVPLLSGIKMNISLFGVKIPPVKQLLISIDFFVEQPTWGRSAAATPKQKQTITMAASIVPFVVARKDHQEGQKSTLKACDPVVTVR